MQDLSLGGGHGFAQVGHLRHQLNPVRLQVHALVDQGVDLNVNLIEAFITGIFVEQSLKSSINFQLYMETVCK